MTATNRNKNHLGNAGETAPNSKEYSPFRILINLVIASVYLMLAFALCQFHAVDLNPGFFCLEVSGVTLLPNVTGRLHRLGNCRHGCPHE